jgi:hypothetical protein
MAYELWISPTTGIRRKGTTFKELQTLFIENVTTKCIFEPLNACNIDADPGIVRQTIEDKDFDTIGVIDGVDRVIGYLEKKDLYSNSIQFAMKPFEPGLIVSGSTPISKLLTILKSREFVFVIAEDKIRGIVTRADINKPVVRIYLFGIISLFELHLNFWIRKFYSDDSWLNCLNVTRKNKTIELLKSRKIKNDELSLLDCLQFCDKRDILMQSKSFLKQFSYLEKKFERFLKDIEIVRNDLAHSQNSVYTSLKWADFVVTINETETFLANSEELAK